MLLWFLMEFKFHIWAQTFRECGLCTLLRVDGLETFLLDINYYLPNAQSILCPILDYAEVSYRIWYTPSWLHWALNICVKFIFGLRKFEPSLQWLPIRRRRDLHIVSFVTALYSNPLPLPTSDNTLIFILLTSAIRSSDTIVLFMSNDSSKFYTNSCIVSAIRLWFFLS